MSALDGAVQGYEFDLGRSLARQERGSVSRRGDSTEGMADSGAESGAQSHLAWVGLDGSLRFRRHCRWERHCLQRQDKDMNKHTAT